MLPGGTIGVLALASNAASSQLPQVVQDAAQTDAVAWIAFGIVDKMLNKLRTSHSKKSEERHA